MSKKRNYEKTALTLSIIALVSGIIHIFCEFFPFEYQGEGGLDYLGQAILWVMMVKVLLYGTLIVYVVFAILATVFSVKAIKAKDKRKKGVVSLILAWICGLVVAGLITANFVIDYNSKKNIDVEVTEVALTTDFDGREAVRVEIELYNGTNTTISYLSSVYDEVSQYGKELTHAVLPEDLDDDDPELESLKPGESVTIVKGYEVRYPDEPVYILCRSFDGKFVYVDEEFDIEK